MIDFHLLPRFIIANTSEFGNIKEKKSQSTHNQSIFKTCTEGKHIKYSVYLPQIFLYQKIVFAIYRWSTSDNHEHLRRLCCVICQSSIMFAWKFLHLPMYMYFLTWQIKFIYSRNIQTLYNAIWNTGALINV